MRNDIETREIADAELDAVSGGVAELATGLVGAVTNDVMGAATSLETVQYVTGAVGSLTGGLTGGLGISAGTNGVSVGL